MTYDAAKDGDRGAVIIDVETKKMVTEMHLLLTDENIGLCRRMKVNEAAIIALDKWKTYVSGACVAVGAMIGAWWEKR